MSSEAVKEFSVTTREERRFRVDYVVKAKSEADAREAMKSGRAYIVDENAEMESIISQDILSVEEL